MKLVNRHADTIPGGGKTSSAEPFPVPNRPESAPVLVLNLTENNATLQAQ
jgi:hypothetical protein